LPREKNLIKKYENKNYETRNECHIQICVKEGEGNTPREEKGEVGKKENGTPMKMQEKNNIILICNHSSCQSKKSLLLG
jgi:hypothetical protein